MEEINVKLDKLIAKRIDEILERVEEGITTVEDADALRSLFEIYGIPFTPPEVQKEENRF